MSPAPSDSSAASPASPVSPAPEPVLPRLTFALPLLLLCGAAGVASADTLYLKDGRVLAAEDCRRVGEEVRCGRAGGIIGIPADQVLRIEKDPRDGSRSRPRRTRQPDEEADPPAISTQGLPQESGGGLDPEAARERLARLERGLGKVGVDQAATRAQIAVLNAYLGNAAMAGKDYDTAELHYRRSLEQDPTLTVVGLNMATLLITVGRYEEAESVLQDALARHPDHPRALFLLGESASQQGRLEQAIALWEAALAIEPSQLVETRLARARRRGISSPTPRISRSGSTATRHPPSWPRRRSTPWRMRGPSSRSDWPTTPKE